MIDSFHWNKNYETGQPDVDHQHHQLVEIINRFGGLLAENKIVLADIQLALKELTDYTYYHFEEEETLMRKVGVDKRHLNHQIKEHQAFLSEISLMSSSITQDNLAAAKQLLSFLINWLAYHILGTDQSMARQIVAIKTGASPGEAYEAEKKQRDRSTEPLLNALNGLFEQVSMRNKELLQLNQTLEEKVALRTKELSEANLRLEELSLTDALTQLPNRRHAMRRLETIWQESVEKHIPLVCMMIDADHFKEVNDTYGHDAGDIVLKELARTLKHAFRSDDVVCRLGGDEFFVICPNTHLEGGMYAAEITRSAVSALRVPTGGEPWHGSISIGVAVRSPKMTGYEELIKAADNSVYTAKQNGKNCVRTTS